jgi:predicted  nucleic acid-binding Zn-ribbon protein
MSILDRVTKAVGEAVDRGKKEVDQFVRIQKINSRIGDIEKSIGESNSQIQRIKIKIGEMAIDMLQTGTLSSPEMKTLLDQIAGIQQQIESFEAEIKQKKAEIESLKTEAKSTPPPSPGVADSAIPPPPPSAADRFCPKCGARASAGAFCAECGARFE